MIDPTDQLELFREAVQLLGGPRSAARAIKVSERHMVNLLAAKATLHDGFLRDAARALLDHAAACHAAERRLTPALAVNRADGQPREDGRRTGLRGVIARRRERGDWDDRPGAINPVTTDELDEIAKDRGY